MRPKEKDLQVLSLSLRNMTVTAYTLDSVQAVFVELFCSPKISLESPSLRLSGQGSSASKTFIVADYPEDEYGLRAIDESTGEGYFWWWKIMFLDMGRQRACLAVQKVSGSSC